MPAEPKYESRVERFGDLEPGIVGTNQRPRDRDIWIAGRIRSVGRRSEDKGCGRRTTYQQDALGVAKRGAVSGRKSGKLAGVDESPGRTARFSSNSKTARVEPPMQCGHETRRRPGFRNFGVLGHTGASIKLLQSLGQGSYKSLPIFQFRPQLAVGGSLRRVS